MFVDEGNNVPLVSAPLLFLLLLRCDDDDDDDVCVSVTREARVAFFFIAQSESRVSEHRRRCFQS